MQIGEHKKTGCRRGTNLIVFNDSVVHPKHFNELYQMHIEWQLRVRKEGELVRALVRNKAFQPPSCAQAAFAKLAAQDLPLQHIPSDQFDWI